QQHLEAIQDGRFSFAYGISPWLAGLLIIGLVALVWLMYRRTTRQLSPGWKAWLIGLRSLVLIVLFLLLLRPVVHIDQVTPQQTYLAVLVDDSQSMGIQDLAGSRQRRDLVVDGLYGNGGLLDALDETFHVR